MPGQQQRKQNRQTQQSGAPQGWRDSIQQTQQPKQPPQRGGFGGRIRAFRTRFVMRLREGHWLRLHMSLIMAAVVLSGMLFSRLLVSAGMQTMWTRYVVAVFLSYGVFFVCLRLWLWSMESRSDWGNVDLGGGPGSGGGGGVHGDGTVAVSDCGGADWGEAGGSDCGGGDWSADAAASDCGGGSWSGGSGGGGGSSGGGGGSFDLGDGEGLAIVLVLVVVAVVLGAGIYVIYEAPLIMSEAAFQVVLAGALTRTAQKARRGQLERPPDGAAGGAASPHWTWPVLRKTWIPLLIVLVVAAGAGAIGSAYCPGAHRMHDVARCPKDPATGKAIGFRTTTSKPARRP